MTDSVLLQAAELPVSEPDADAGTRARLVTAAVELFSFRGYDGVSVREIERLAGANRGSAAYYYGTKDRLWKAAMGSVLEKFEEEMYRHRELLPILSPAERSRVVLHMYGRFGGKYPELFRLLVHHGGDWSERGAWLIEKLRPVMQFLFEMTGSGGERSEAEARHFFMFAGASALIYSMPAIAKGLAGFDLSEPGFVEKFTEDAVDIFFPLFAGLSENTSPNGT